MSEIGSLDQGVPAVEKVDLAVPTGIAFTNKYSKLEALFTYIDGKWYTEGREVPMNEQHEWGLPTPAGHYVVKTVEPEPEIVKEKPRSGQLSPEAQFWSGIDKRIIGAVERSTRLSRRFTIALFLGSIVISVVSEWRSSRHDTAQQHSLEQIVAAQKNIRQDMTTIALAAAGELSQSDRAEMYRYVSMRISLINRLLQMKGYLDDVNYALLDPWEDMLEGDPSLPTTQGQVMSNNGAAELIRMGIGSGTTQLPSRDDAKSIAALERAKADVENLLSVIPDHLDIENMHNPQKDAIREWLIAWTGMLDVLHTKLVLDITVLRHRHAQIGRAVSAQSTNAMNGPEPVAPSVASPSVVSNPFGVLSPSGIGSGYGIARP